MKRMVSDTGQPPSERSRHGEEAVILLGANQNSNDARKMELLERRLTAPPEVNEHSRTPSGAGSFRNLPPCMVIILSSLLAHNDARPAGFVARTEQPESPESDDEVSPLSFARGVACWRLFSPLLACHSGDWSWIRSALHERQEESAQGDVP